MVKPPRTMQPEAVNLAKAGRAPGRAFQEDSFHNYMARKIDRQRQQFGALPPPPPPSAHVSFDRKASAEASAVRNDEALNDEALNDEALNDEALTVNDENSVGELPKTKRRKKKLAMASVLQHLKRRHGRVRKLKLAAADNHKGETETSLEETSFEEISFEGSGPVASSACLTQLPRYPAATLDEQQQQQEESWALSVANESPTIHAESPRLSPSKKRGRTDLFFTGVVVLINGYTHPDAESLQRLLQRHGGDVERYETTRVTHILAEHLSTAKAKVYANKRRSIPVVHPSWVVACVQEQRQLSHGPYLISEVRDLHQQPSVASFFQRQLPAAKEETPTLQVEDSEGIRERNCTGRRSDVLEGSEAKDKDRKGLAKDTKEKTSVAAEKIVKHGVEDEGNLTETACPVECTAKEIISGEAGGVSRALTAPPSRKQKGFVEVDGPAPKANDAARLSLHGGSHGNERTQEHSMAGRVRTVGTDPQFLESFFAASRLSFIGSFRQRTHGAGVGTANTSRVCDRPSKRFVLHVDMDSFFASVVLRKYPQYKDNPVAISHHGKSGPEEGEKGGKDSTSECATCNYHARRFGIKKGMFLGRARALCPSLIVLPYDFEGYEEVSEQVGEICHSHAAAHFGVIETVSCDESYMEVYVESVSVVTQLVQDIRREVEERTQCTASIGVARNKLLAKLATDRIKPNGWYVATDHLDLLRTLKLRELHGIGYRSGPKLTEKGLVSVRDVWDRGDSAAKELQTILGKQLGSKIYKFCQGIDDRPVQAVERKTIGAECSYGVRFNGPYGVDFMVEGLCKEVQKRMEQAGVTASKLTLKVKQRKQGAKPPPKFLGHGSCHNLSKSLDLSRATRHWEVMARLGIQIFGEMNVVKEDVRGMGVSLSKLHIDGQQTSENIRDFFGPRGESTEDRTRDESHPATSAVAFASSADKGGENSPTKTSIGILASDDEPTGDGKSDDEDEVVILSQPSASSFGADADTGLRSVRSRRSIDSLDDIVLPALSQIRMSQVEVLPSPLRRKVQAKIDEQRGVETVESSPDLSLAIEPRFRQTNLQRMMRLAAVKAGALNEKAQSDISLTQLDCLPIEIQLQVANNDTLALGTHSATKKTRSVASSRPTKLDGKRAPADTMKSPPRKGRVRETLKRKAIEEDPQFGADRVRPMNETEFFRQNILPLSSFLDDHAAVTEESLVMVQTFVLQFVDDYTWPEVTLLLRSIRNRRDAWSQQLQEGGLYQKINERFQHETGAELDMD